MAILVIIVVALLLAGGALASEWWRKRQDASAVLNHPVNTQPAEDAAANNAHEQAREGASNVLRSSSPDLRNAVDELRARGRAGK